MFNIILCLSIIINLQFVFSKDDLCGVVTRKQWNAEPYARVTYMIRPLNKVIIQHTVTPECQTRESCSTQVKSIQNYHMNNLNFDDIGISFLVGGNGDIFEGAGWEHVGAHTKGSNSNSIGISFIGNFSNKLPSSEALEATKQFLECGIRQGHLSSDYKLYGHRQFIATESPGGKLFRHIKAWPHWTEKV